MAFFHDSTKSFEMFHKFAVKSWGNHKIMPYLEDEVESYEIIRKMAPLEVLDVLGSCMTEDKFKKEKQKELKEKYKVVLDNGYACGLCYKCAEKSVIDSLFFNADYPKGYLKQCRRILLEKANSTIQMNGYPYGYLQKLGAK